MSEQHEALPCPLCGAASHWLLDDRKRSYWQCEQCLMVHVPACWQLTAEQEKAEMEVIRRFMPQQLSDAEITEAVESVVQEIGARELKDMGRTMAALKEQYAGRMDFSKASGLVRQKLA